MSSIEANFCFKMLTYCLPVAFFFQVRVPSIPYVGIGNSTNKKDAQTNAAYDFANYLVRVGKLSEAELPSKVVGIINAYQIN